MVQAQGTEELPCHINDLGIEGGVIITNSLTAELIVLPVSPRLRSFVSKNRSDIVQLYRLWQVVHAVLQVGPAHRGSALRSQGYFIPSFVSEGIHLLLDNVSFLSNATGKKLGIFKGGGINTFITVELADINRLLLYIAPVWLFLR